jgi:hypothetical protein
MYAMLSLAAALSVAIVTEDQTALRAAPHDSAPRQTALWRGDWLEVRGARTGFLQVYDHRRERPGYVRPAQVRTYALDEQSAPELRAVIGFLRDTPGAEALGIGYVALYLKAAPAGTVDVSLLAALGVMAERLAERASAQRGEPGPAGAALGAHLEVAEGYGVHFVHHESEGRTVTCYDGEAFRQVLALGGSAEERLAAVLGLTRGRCLDPALGPVELEARNEWRLGVLGRAETAALPAWLRGRIALRRAEVLAALTFHRARRGEFEGAAKASQEAVRALALADKNELADEDLGPYEATAVRVASARWAGIPVGPLAARALEGLEGIGKTARAAAAIAIRTTPRQPGETCVQLIDRTQVDLKAKAPRVLLERCTYGLVWPASARVAPDGKALALVVQPLASWSELWIFRNGGRDGAVSDSDAGGENEVQAETSDWHCDTLLPAAADPELGYVELAGWSPDGGRLLVVREGRAPGGLRREFQVLRTETLVIERHARNPELLIAFRRWAGADWKQHTLALR